MTILFKCDKVIRSMKNKIVKKGERKSMKKRKYLALVSFGPTLRGVHSPDERLEIPTVDKFWKLLVGVVDALR